MSSPVPPSPPKISRHGRDEDELKSSSSRSHHRTARDYRASRSRSRGRGRQSPEREHSRRYRQRTYSRSRSRDNSRYGSRRHRVERSSSRHRRDRSLSKHRHERSSSRSRVRNDRRPRSSHRSRSRSYTRSRRTSHRSRSRSRSHSHSRRRNNRSRSGSRHSRVEKTHSQSRRRAEEKPAKPKVIVLSTESYKDSLKNSSKLPSVSEEPSSSSASTSSSAPKIVEDTQSWKNTKVDQIGVYSNLQPDAPIDREKIQKEIEEKLRLALAREGKVYPHPKPEPSHPVFANDGSFLEIFKKMQQQQTFVQQQVGEGVQIHAVPNTVAKPAPSVAPVPQHHPPPPLPIMNRRRGGKILKTGVVAKPKSANDMDTGDVKDFWSIYLREVKKYKSTACESESKTRPLVR